MRFEAQPSKLSTDIKARARTASIVAFGAVVLTLRGAEAWFALRANAGKFIVAMYFRIWVVV